jgi:prepilin-type N-terminal cleavage/methylation domain-containing protein
MASPTPLTGIGRDEDGFTLVELLVAIAIGLIVLGAAVMVFTAGVHSQLRADSQSAAVQHARTTMERLVRELRQGSGLVPGTTPTSTQLSFITYVHSTCTGATSSAATVCSVTYTCNGGTCTRRVAKADGTAPGAAVKVVTGLSSSNVFAYSPSAAAPTYVTATLRLPTFGGGNAITLSDGAAFRNVSG